MATRTITFRDDLAEWLEERARATEMTFDAVVEQELEQARKREAAIDVAIDYTLREYREILERLGQ